MSMLDVLLRYIDPVQHRQRQEERRRKREVMPPEVDDDFVDLPPPAPPSEPRELACRICDHRGRDRFCPRCLADTMAPPPRR
jgi:hypothetical protein